MRQLFILVFLLFTVPVLGQVETQKLVVTNSKAWKPFSYLDENGKPAGILIDLWQEYSLKNNIEVEFLLLNWNDSLRAMQDGRADIHGGLLWSENREAFLDYSDPIMTIDTQLFFNTQLMGSDVGVFLEGNHEYSVGLVEGGYEEEFTRLHFPNIKIKSYPNNEIMLEDAFAGNIQAFVADLQVANFYLYSSRQPSKFIGVRHFYSGDLRPAVAEGNKPLQQQVRFGMSQISDKDRSRIFGRWMYINTVYPDYLWPLAIILSFFIAISYILMLRMSVRSKTRELQKANVELKKLSETDPLTGLSNRRFFMEKFKQLCDTEKSLTVIVFDIDDFKRINDSFGHECGDTIILSVAQAVKGVLKREYLFSRIGGEEFAVVFTGSTVNQSTIKAHKICSAVRLTKHPLLESGDLTVTVSLGCAFYKKSHKHINLSDADKLMYNAKNLGKDRPVVKVINAESQSIKSDFEHLV